MPPAGSRAALTTCSAQSVTLLQQKRFEIAAASYETKDHHSRPFDSVQQDVLTYRTTAYARA
jgi:hypothetical protein